jgi:hypothetical protein
VVMEKIAKVRSDCLAVARSKITAFISSRNTHIREDCNAYSMNSVSDSNMNARKPSSLRGLPLNLIRVLNPDGSLNDGKSPGRAVHEEH